MIQVVVIGSGNVAQHLIKAFTAAPAVNLVQVYARRPKQLAHLLPSEKITDSLTNLVDADVYIISVSDDAIGDISSQLPFFNKLVVHTSGSVGIGQLDDKNRRGVFYPLQTFSKNKEVDFTIIPFCLETELEEDFTTIETLAFSLSRSVYSINSKQRQSLHVAAVFVSNFANHMYTLGSQICDENNIPFDILKPLINETADKIKTLPPLNAQTGPAVRNDVNTLQRHLNFLQDENKKEVYTLLTQSIQQANE